MPLCTPDQITRNLRDKAIDKLNQKEGPLSCFEREREMPEKPEAGGGGTRVNPD